MAQRFVRVSGSEYPCAGYSLWFEMPTITNEVMKKKLGSGLAREDNRKYSSKLVFMDRVTRRLFTAYKCFGEWRIGAPYEAHSEEVKQAILSWLTS